MKLFRAMVNLWVDTPERFMGHINSQHSNAKLYFSIQYVFKNIKRIEIKIHSNATF